MHGTHVAGEQDLLRHRSRGHHALAGGPDSAAACRTSRSSSSALPADRRRIIEDPALGFYLYQAAGAAAAARTHPARLRVAVRQSGISRTRSRTPTSCTTARFINDRYGPYIGYAPEIELTDDSTRHRHGLDKARRMPKLEDVAARQYNSVSFDADWINFDATVSTTSRPDRDRSGISAEGVGGERAPLLPLQDGRAHPEHLLVPVGALRGAARPLAERQPGDLLPARPRVQHRHHDGEHEGDARLLHGELQSLPVPPAAHHRVSALRRRSPSRSPTRFPSPSRSDSSPRSAASRMRSTCPST